MMNRVIKDPLVHFLVAGFLIFTLLSIANPPAQDKQIIVDRNALLSFIQFRSKAFEPGVAADILDGFSVEERQRIIDDYVREEALHREAKSMGLDVDDYVIRQRLVQKFEFLTQSPANSAPEPAALLAYYEDNKSDYYVQPGATFTHVFVSNRETREDTLAQANALLRQLRETNAEFQDATQYGDRFLFHKNYVERTESYIKSHFGDVATETIFSDKTPFNEWIGPLSSSYGAHLIFVAQKTAGRLPPLDEVQNRVAADYLETQRREINDALVSSIIDGYDVVIDLNQPDETQSP